MAFVMLSNPAASMAQIALGIEGAIIMMISHAFISGALFLGVGVVYDRMHSRQIRDFGGIVHKMPLFATFFLLFAMANTGLPGTSGFVGEFMIILSSFKANPWISFLAASTLILSACYMLWMYKRVFFGAVGNQHVAHLTDLNPMEITVFTVLAGFVIVFGIYPDAILNVMHSSVQHLIELSRIQKLA
jgi:NADH-quinone oxidoreductase subunit M